MTLQRPILIRNLLDCAAMLQLRYGTTIVPKATSRLMRVAGWVLEQLDILSARRFMADYTTTLGRTIYMPYALGSGDASPAMQLRTITHEHQHVVQEQIDGWRYYLGYACSRTRRARYEAEAYATGLEIDRLLGLPVDTDAEAELVDGYGFDAAAREVFRVALKTWWERIVAGEHTEAGGAVIERLCLRMADEIIEEVLHK